jgi:hypothetical protein
VTNINTPPNLNHLPPPPDQATQDAWAESQQAIIDSSQRAMEKAANVMERMDHKDVLYRNLGQLATGTGGVAGANEVHRDPSKEPPRPRTFIERFNDKRMEKKSWNRAYKAAERKNVVKAYGGKETANTMGIGARGSLAKRKSEARGARRRGEISAREQRQRQMQARGSLVTYENPRQRQTSRQLKDARGAAEKATRQPISRRWRNFRRERAIGKIQESHARAEQARQNIQGMGLSEQRQQQAFDPETGELL